jgi:regulatory protein
VAFASRSPVSRSSGRGDRGRRAIDGETAGGVPAAPTADPVDVARQICLHQLEFAPRTRAELAATLAKKGVEDEVAAQVLSRFAEVGMIDDAVFAQMWVTSRQRGRGLAGPALRQELRRKGVDEPVIAEAIAQLDPDAEAATARALVERRLRSTRGLAPDVRLRRLAGMLARKGYPAGTAFRVVREALAEEGQELDVPFDALSIMEEQ